MKELRFGKYGVVLLLAFPQIIMPFLSLPQGPNLVVRLDVQSMMAASN